MRLSLRIGILLSLILAVCVVSTFSVRAQETVFSKESLATFDGRDGRAAYFAYKGKVYDVTKSSLWKLGEHFGLRAGFDLTDKMEGAPHGDEVMAKVPLIGTYGDTTTTQPSAVPNAQSPKSNTEKSWYDAPIRLWGISILGWTGIILGVVFFLNFATCFALPWSKFNLPWVGTRPGPDSLDASGAHMKWTMLHKYFAWATIVLGIFHGVVGFLQVFFKMYL